ncbi:hypothetical protein AWRI1631_112700 [Saccharomyces cerevisiae AWRI1631]|uniref:Uncharacterized protein n=1 Tax=Saccharomyces cerevisiae (strain AWRI1631) TaxID=545124 RepID=B5VMJ5_YEAS6|nr:hypothetical protein AWRI1631_112700 [Saccharomyces cerevisiae AWRI1631]
MVLTCLVVLFLCLRISRSTVTLWALSFQLISQPSAWS